MRREIDAPGLADPVAAARALDQLVAEQGEDAAAEEDRPGVAVPVDAGGAAAIVGIARMAARGELAGVGEPAVAGGCRNSIAAELPKKRLSAGSSGRATGRPSMPESAVGRRRIGAEEEGVAAGLALGRVGAGDRRRRAGARAGVSSTVEKASPPSPAPMTIASLPIGSIRSTWWEMGRRIAGPPCTAAA